MWTFTLDWIRTISWEQDGDLTIGLEMQALPLSRGHCCGTQLVICCRWALHTLWSSHFSPRDTPETSICMCLRGGGTSACSILLQRSDLERSHMLPGNNMDDSYSCNVTREKISLENVQAAWYIGWLFCRYLLFYYKQNYLYTMGHSWTSGGSVINA